MRIHEFIWPQDLVDHIAVHPVLRALGWDTANTNMVEVEKTLGEVRADYALYDNNAIIKIVVEAPFRSRFLIAEG